MDKNMDVWLDNKIVWKHISLNRVSFGLSWNTETLSQSQSVPYCPSQKENKSEFRIQLGNSTFRISPQANVIKNKR